MTRYVYLILAVSMLLISSCSSIGGEPTPVPLTETFRNSLDDLISAGSKLNAATSQGVNYQNYRDYYAEVGGAYELALASWPDEFAPEAKEQFAQAIVGWDLAGFMWNAQINDENIPSSDPRNREFESYGGELLRKVGTRFQVSDENIGILLALASEQFETGRDTILPLLP